MDDDQLQVQHFCLLKEKFHATGYPESSPNSLLYLILRKADANIAISEQEQNWLQNYDLDKTLASIKLNQYKSYETQRLETEFTQLKHQYDIPDSIDLPTPNPLHAILWQFEKGRSVADADIQWLYAQQLNKQAHLAESIREFASLKKQFKADSVSLFQPDTNLYPILKKLHAKEQLSEVEAEWLLDEGLLDTFEIFEQQEKERKLQAEFVMLKSKYGLKNYPETSTYSFLFSILRRIDGGQLLDCKEVDWLKKEGLLKLVNLDQDLKNHQIFEHLKAKYRVNPSDQTPFSEKFFKLLQAIDAKTYLSDREVEWLESQGFTETAAFAHVIRFLTLKKKYRLVDPNLPLQPFYDIMVQIEREERLDRKQIAQLIHEGYLWKDGLIAKAYHCLEAQFYVQELHRTGNKWHIPSAVSDWRKAGELEKALQLSEHLKLKHIYDDKLKAAILTTRGQTLRDMGRLDEAISCAQSSIELQLDDHRPYTLMASILDRQFKPQKAQEFWDKAIDRGADPNERDYEMKRLVRNLKNDEERQEIVQFLLQKAPGRYAWAREYLRG